MGTFYMRTTSPTASNKFYHNVTYNPFATPQYNMPNCTCYAFGRFSEIIGSTASLPTGNAGTWWGSVGSAYSRSQQPQVGAIMCWSIPGRAGHVGVVERITRNADGSVKSVLCSQSSYGSNHNGRYFWVEELTPPSYRNYVGSSAIFQGFILNPAVAADKCKRLADSSSTQTTTIAPTTTTQGRAVSTGKTVSGCDAFMSVAKSKVDDSSAHAWVQSMMPGIGNLAWCAAFVSACAKKAGVAGKVIGVSASCAGMEDATKALGGVSVKGPRYGNTSYVPKIGDLVMFLWGSEYGYHWYDHVGIVSGYVLNPPQLETIEGNTSGGCHRRYYTMNGSSAFSNLKSVATYVHPNWSTVGGVSVDNCVSQSMDSYGFAQKMYDSINSKTDAIIREVGYVNSSMKPSITTSSIELSLINHTLIFSGLMLAQSKSNGLQSGIQNAIQLSGSGYGSTVVYSTAKFSSTQQEIYQFFNRRAVNVSVICGILANIQYASNYKTNAQFNLVGGKYLSIGLFGWTKYRDKMREKVPKWQNDMTGQLNFFWDQLTSWFEYSGLKTKLFSISVTDKASAGLAGQYIAQYFETASSDTAKINKCKNTAELLFSQLVPQVVYNT